ncbi:MAG: M23 family metallopeptidase [Armatimonadota bacterium]|nr:MAG: M23 family metallopeptidase [Armatimonadota bacterium]
MLAGSQQGFHRAPGLRARRSLAVVASWLLALALAGAGRVSGDLPLLDVAPKSVRQGDWTFVFVRPGAVAPAAGECRWLGKTHSLFPTENGYRAILPVSPDAPTGQQMITVVLQAPGGEARETGLPVTIVKRSFGVQKLTMKRQTSQLYTDPATAQEGKTIRAALSQLSAEQLWHGPFAWPVKGRVSTGFGLARSINGEIQYRHKGLDIAAATGTPVLAPSDGVVRLVRQDYKLHGKTVVVDHGQGLASLYLHLSEILVREGQEISSGQRLGKVGATGVATGPHLHWAVYVAGEPVDPHFWIDVPEEGR